MSQNELFNFEDEDLEHLLENLDKVDIDDPKAWPQTLSDMVLVVNNHLTSRLGYEKSKAIKLTKEVVTVIAHYLGGRQTYLPRDDKLKLALRDIEIWHDFTGHNTNQLASKHGLTVTQMYAIIQTQRNLNLRRIQPELNGLSER